MATKKSGNTSKYESYKEAWRRIRSSQEAEFFLEAVAIEESIISDRLVSYLSRPGCATPVSKDKKGRWPSFGQLVDKLAKEFPDGLAAKGFDDLVSALGDWRELRNDALHAIAKSDPGTATVPVAEFVAKAKVAAAQGEQLARAVTTWHKGLKRSV